MTDRARFPEGDLKVRFTSPTEGVVLCNWFAQCVNDAVALREHPILDPVPICADCNAKVDAL